MSKALPHIRADLGPDAVILTSRQVQRSGLFGRLRAPVWEVLAAVDDAEPGDISLARVAAPAQGGAAPVRPARQRPSVRLPVQSPPPVPASGELYALREEIRDLRTAVERLSRQSAISPVLQLPPLLQEVHQLLLEQRILPEVATRVVLEVAETLSPQALAERQAVRAQVEWQLTNLLPVKEMSNIRRDHPRVLFVVGPTGTGKTTTLAKLAADYALRWQIPVSLVTADTYRVGAIQQLETYGEILGLPVKVAYTPGDLGDLIERQEEGGITLVDTPGHSPNNRTGLDLLRSFTAVAERKEVFLTLSACTKGPDLNLAVDRFQRIPLDGLLFTKLDETEAMGPLFNVTQQAKLPLTYLTTGQQVPDDIEIARPEEIARWALKHEQPWLKSLG
jgi:flagellar biosynthesis protein FlhF